MTENKLTNIPEPIIATYGTFGGCCIPASLGKDMVELYDDNKVNFGLVIADYNPQEPVSVVPNTRHVVSFADKNGFDKTVETMQQLLIAALDIIGYPQGTPITLGKPMSFLDKESFESFTHTSDTLENNLALAVKRYNDSYTST